MCMNIRLISGVGSEGDANDRWEISVLIPATCTYMYNIFMCVCMLYLVVAVVVHRGAGG